MSESLYRMVERRDTFEFHPQVDHSLIFSVMEHPQPKPHNPATEPRLSGKRMSKRGSVKDLSAFFESKSHIHGELFHGKTSPSTVKPTRSVKNLSKLYNDERVARTSKGKVALPREHQIELSGGNTHAPASFDVLVREVQKDKEGCGREGLRKPLGPLERPPERKNEKGTYERFDLMEIAKISSGPATPRLCPKGIADCYCTDAAKVQSRTLFISPPRESIMKVIDEQTLSVPSELQTENVHLVVDASVQFCEKLTVAMKTIDVRPDGDLAPMRSGSQRSELGLAAEEYIMLDSLVEVDDLNLVAPTVEVNAGVMPKDTLHVTAPGTCRLGPRGYITTPARANTAQSNARKGGAVPYDERRIVELVNQLDTCLTHVEEAAARGDSDGFNLAIEDVAKAADETIIVVKRMLPNVADSAVRAKLLQTLAEFTAHCEGTFSATLKIAKLALDPKNRKSSFPEALLSTLRDVCRTLCRCARLLASYATSAPVLYRNSFVACRPLSEKQIKAANRNVIQRCASKLGLETSELSCRIQSVETPEEAVPSIYLEDLIPREGALPDDEEVVARLMLESADPIPLSAGDWQGPREGSSEGSSERPVLASLEERLPSDEDVIARVTLDIADPLSYSVIDWQGLCEGISTSPARLIQREGSVTESTKGGEMRSVEYVVTVEPSATSSPETYFAVTQPGIYIDAGLTELCSGSKIHTTTSCVCSITGSFHMRKDANIRMKGEDSGLNFHSGPTDFVRIQDRIDAKKAAHVSIHSGAILLDTPPGPFGLAESSQDASGAGELLCSKLTVGSTLLAQCEHATAWVRLARNKTASPPTCLRKLVALISAMEAREEKIDAGAEQMEEESPAESGRTKEKEEEKGKESLLEDSTESKVKVSDAIQNEGEGFAEIEALAALVADLFESHSLPKTDEPDTELYSSAEEGSSYDAQSISEQEDKDVAALTVLLLQLLGATLEMNNTALLSCSEVALLNLNSIAMEDESIAHFPGYTEVNAAGNVSLSGQSAAHFSGSTTIKGAGAFSLSGDSTASFSGQNHIALDGAVLVSEHSSAVFEGENHITAAGGFRVSGASSTSLSGKNHITVGGDVQILEQSAAVFDGETSIDTASSVVLDGTARAKAVGPFNLRAGGTLCVKDEAQLGLEGTSVLSMGAMHTGADTTITMRAAEVKEKNEDGTMKEEEVKRGEDEAEQPDPALLIAAGEGIDFHGRLEADCAVHIVATDMRTTRPAGDTSASLKTADCTVDCSCGRLRLESLWDIRGNLAVTSKDFYASSAADLMTLSDASLTCQILEHRGRLSASADCFMAPLDPCKDSTVVLGGCVDVGGSLAVRFRSVLVPSGGNLGCSSLNFGFIASPDIPEATARLAEEAVVRSESGSKTASQHSTVFSSIGGGVDLHGDMHCGDTAWFDSCGHVRLNGPVRAANIVLLTNCGDVDVNTSLGDAAQPTALHIQTNDGRRCNATFGTTASVTGQVYSQSDSWTARLGSRFAGNHNTAHVFATTGNVRDAGEWHNFSSLFFSAERGHVTLDGKYHVPELIIKCEEECELGTDAQLSCDLITVNAGIIHLTNEWFAGEDLSTQTVRFTATSIIIDSHVDIPAKCVVELMADRSITFAPGGRVSLQEGAQLICRTNGRVFAYGPDCFPFPCGVVRCEDGNEVVVEFLDADITNATLPARRTRKLPPVCLLAEQGVYWDKLAFSCDEACRRMEREQSLLQAVRAKVQSALCTIGRLSTSLLSLPKDRPEPSEQNDEKEETAAKRQNGKARRTDEEDRACSDGGDGGERDSTYANRRVEGVFSCYLTEEESKEDKKRTEVEREREQSRLHVELKRFETSLTAFKEEEEHASRTERNARTNLLNIAKIVCRCISPGRPCARGDVTYSELSTAFSQCGAGGRESANYITAAALRRACKLLYPFDPELTAPTLAVSSTSPPSVAGSAPAEEIEVRKGGSLAVKARNVAMKGTASLDKAVLHTDKFTDGVREVVEGSGESSNFKVHGYTRSVNKEDAVLDLKRPAQAEVFSHETSGSTTVKNVEARSFVEVAGRKVTIEGTVTSKNADITGALVEICGVVTGTSLVYVEATKGDITISGGRIIGEHVSLVAKRDILIRTKQTSYRGRYDTMMSWTKQAITADKVWAQAGRDVEVDATSIESKGDIKIVCRNLRLKCRTHTYISYRKRKRKRWWKKKKTITHWTTQVQGAELQAGGDIIVQAENIYGRASAVMARRRISLRVTGRIQFVDAVGKQITETKTKGLFSRSKCRQEMEISFPSIVLAPVVEMFAAEEIEFIGSHFRASQAKFAAPKIAFKARVLKHTFKCKSSGWFASTGAMDLIRDPAAAAGRHSLAGAVRNFTSATSGAGQLATGLTQVLPAGAKSLTGFARVLDSGPTAIGMEGLKQLGVARATIGYSRSSTRATQETAEASTGVADRLELVGLDDNACEEVTLEGADISAKSARIKTNRLKVMSVELHSSFKHSESSIAATADLFTGSYGVTVSGTRAKGRSTYHHGSWLTTSHLEADSKVGTADVEGSEWRSQTWAPSATVDHVNVISTQRTTKRTQKSGSLGVGSDLRSFSVSAAMGKSSAKVMDGHAKVTVTKGIARGQIGSLHIKGGTIASSEGGMDIPHVTAEVLKDETKSSSWSTAVAFSIPKSSTNKEETGGADSSSSSVSKGKERTEESSASPFPVSLQDFNFSATSARTAVDNRAVMEARDGVTTDRIDNPSALVYRAEDQRQVLVDRSSRIDISVPVSTMRGILIDVEEMERKEKLRNMNIILRVTPAKQAGEERTEGGADKEFLVEYISVDEHGDEEVARQYVVPEKAARELVGSARGLKGGTLHAKGEGVVFAVDGLAYEEFANRHSFSQFSAELCSAAYLVAAADNPKAAASNWINERSRNSTRYKNLEVLSASQDMIIFVDHDEKELYTSVRGTDPSHIFSDLFNDALIMLGFDPVARTATCLDQYKKATAGLDLRSYKSYGVGHSLGGNVVEAMAPEAGMEHIILKNPGGVLPIVPAVLNRLLHKIGSSLLTAVRVDVLASKGSFDHFLDNFMDKETSIDLGNMVIATPQV